MNLLTFVARKFSVPLTHTVNRQNKETVYELLLAVVATMALGSIWRNMIVRWKLMNKLLKPSMLAIFAPTLIHKVMQCKQIPVMETIEQLKKMIAKNR